MHFRRQLLTRQLRRRDSLPRSPICDAARLNRIDKSRLKTYKCHDRSLVSSKVSQLNAQTSKPFLRSHQPLYASIESIKPHIISPHPKIEDGRTKVAKRKQERASSAADP
jgi:hypothetical protein